MAKTNGKKKNGKHPLPAVMQPVAPNVGGRPTKLTPEVQEAVLRALRAGNYMETAAAYAGINKDTLYEWMKRGRADLLKGHEGGLYATFVGALDKAIADGEVRDVAIIAQASAQNWTAAAWRLERRFPKRWGRFDRLGLEGAGEDAPPLRIVVSLAAGHERSIIPEEETP